MDAIKIKTRDQRIAEYNGRYPVSIDDATERVRHYFTEKGLNLEKACLKASRRVAEIVDRREYESIYICLREYPMETARPRTFNGHTFSPNAAANKQYFEKAIMQVAKTIKMIATPAEIRIDAYLEMPDKVPPEEVILYEAKVLHVGAHPDNDNIAKCYLDMMTGVLATDDDLYYHTDIWKWYSLEPRVEIRIVYETAVESEFLYKRLKNRKTIKAGIAAGRVELRRL